AGARPPPRSGRARPAGAASSPAGPPSDSAHDRGDPDHGRQQALSRREWPRARGGRGESRRPAPRIPHPPRSLRVRQVHRARHARGAGDARQRRDPDRGGARERPRSRQGGPRVPGPGALPLAYRARQRGLRPRAARRGRGATPRDRARAPGAPRPSRLRGKISPRAVGGHAPARGHRARAGAGHAHRAHGRALRRAGRGAASPHGRLARRRPTPDAQDGGVRDPQPARGHRAIRPHRPDDVAPRPDQRAPRGGAAVSPRPQCPRRGGPSGQAVGGDSRGGAPRHGWFDVSRDTARVLGARVAVLLGALLLWELIAGAVNPLLYVRPSSLPPALANVLLARDVPALGEHALVTAREIVVAFVLAVVVGLWLGFVLGLGRRLGRVYEPMLAAFYAIPSVIWYPSLMLLFGLGP